MLQKSVPPAGGQSHTLNPRGVCTASVFSSLCSVVCCLQPLDINMLLKKRVAPPAPKPPKRPPPAPSRDNSSVTGAPPTAVNPVTHPPAQALIDVKDLTLGEELGEGEFGSVLKGTWKSSDGKIIDVSSRK